MTTRADIVNVARGYVGTPWHHRARLPGVGLDCAGVLICVCRELGIVAPDFDVPEYSITPDGSMLEWCDRYMRRITKAEMQAGDAIVLITDKDPQHLAVLGDYRGGDQFSIIHGTNDRRYMRVIEMRLMFSRDQRFAAAYALPGM